MGFLLGGGRSPSPPSFSNDLGGGGSPSPPPISNDLSNAGFRLIVIVASLVPPCGGGLIALWYLSYVHLDNHNGLIANIPNVSLLVCDLFNFPTS